MTTTPTVRKAKFSPKTGAVTGLQFATVTIGLASGGILTAWSDVDNNVDDDLSYDIAGRLLGVQGKPVTRSQAMPTSSPTWSAPSRTPSARRSPPGRTAQTDREPNTVVLSNGRGALL